MIFLGIEALRPTETSAKTYQSILREILEYLDLQNSHMYYI